MGVGPFPMMNARLDSEWSQVANVVALTTRCKLNLLHGKSNVHNLLSFVSHTPLTEIPATEEMSLLRSLLETMG